MQFLCELGRTVAGMIRIVKIYCHCRPDQKGGMNRIARGRRSAIVGGERDLQTTPDGVKKKKSQVGKRAQSVHSGYPAFDALHSGRARARA